RRDAFLAAAAFALQCRNIAIRHSRPDAGVVCTVGRVQGEPGIPTAVPGVAQGSLHQRALGGTVLAHMLREGQEASELIAEMESVTVEWRPLFEKAPRPFDPSLIQLCEEAVRETTGDAPRLPSGALHDATEMAALMPTVMMFTSSTKGLSH